MKYLASFAAFFLLASCSNIPLYVQNDYLHVDGLASSYVNTPDPHRDKPLLGQRLYITWSLAEELVHKKNTQLKIYLRFCNREEREVCEPIGCADGAYEYKILCDDFFETGGILTYRVEIIADGAVVEKWNHQIWTPTIHVEDD